MVRTVSALVMIMIVAMMHAQTTSTITGVITDTGTEQPVAGATVQVLMADTVLGSATDEEGRYRIEGVPTGIHALQVKRLGYDGVLVPEVWVRAGKVEVMDIAITAVAKELGEVMVEGIAPRMMSTTSSYALTVEQSLRYPATFFDPARLAATRPGVTSMSDQANHFSVRGNGPTSNAYMLEGAEIVNPNHLTNAGTASDLPVLSGGGVSILSAQLLGPSQLLTGSFGVPYGNALGGILDMGLRRGATDKQAFTAQAGLIGIDLSTEGPFKKGGKASYLVNYRYSTLGLLSSMGVDLGDEVITFQDLSFHVSVPMRRGSISFFGMGGMSSNSFAAKDSVDQEFDKDSKDIDYTGRVGAAGGTLRLVLGSNALWRTTMVISANDQEREADDVGRRGFYYTEYDALMERKLSIVSYVRGTCGARFNYQVGGSAMERTMDKRMLVAEVVRGWLLRPYVQGGYAISDRVRVDGGVGYAHYTLSSSAVVEPRATVQWRMGVDRTLSIAAGQRSQLPMVQFFPVLPGSPFLDNSAIGLTRSQDIVLAYDHPIRKHMVLHVEVFHQRMFGVPVADTTGVVIGTARGTSLVNAWDAGLLMDLVAHGEATNTGAELSFQHHFHNNLFYQVNATVFDANFADAYGDVYDARWSTGVIGNIMVGKEFAKQKDRVKRTWGVNGRANMTGGQRYTPAPEAGQVLQPYADRYATFYRIDLRIYLKREHAKRTGMWALDLQNATNAQNEAYRYFDVRKNEVVIKYQLGLIPNISYRIEF